jgi:primosomal protein N' (replication factor Y)
LRRLVTYPGNNRAQIRIVRSGSARVNAFLRVALAAPLPRTFDYLPPSDGTLPAIGSRVEVPFGRARRVGIVVAHVSSPEIPREQLKPVLRVLDQVPLFTPELLANLLRAGDYWCGAVGEVLFGALPSWLREN